MPQNSSRVPQGCLSARLSSALWKVFVRLFCLLRWWYVRLEGLAASINKMPKRTIFFCENAQYFSGLFIWRMATVRVVTSEDLQALLYGKELHCDCGGVDWARVYHKGETKLCTKNHRASGDYSAIWFVPFASQQLPRRTVCTQEL
jgi:hypothetical protein